jgi:tRNA1(Val) A37 N6-methylase TrmN6
MTLADSEITEDAVLGGRLHLRQPRRGHRVGHDAILLAAATGGAYGERVIDLGAGVGSAGLALARRVPGLRVTLVEIDKAMCELARQNVVLNRFEERVDIVRGDARHLDLPPATADRVLMNPPFNDPAKQNVSPHASRALAHMADPDTLRSWAKSAARVLKPQGILTLIWRADGLTDVLDALAAEFGAVVVLPVHPRPGVPAIRVLVRAQKGGEAPLALLPGLELNDVKGKPSAAAEAVLRGAEALPLAKF